MKFNIKVFFKDATSLFVVGTVIGAYVLLIGTDAYTNSAIGAYEVAKEANSQWIALRDATGSEAVSITDMNAGNPLLPENVTGLDILVLGHDVVSDSHKLFFKGMDFTPLKKKLFIGKHKKWKGVDYRAQGLSLFKMNSTNGGNNVSVVFTDVPKGVVRAAIELYENNDVTTVGKSDTSGVIQYYVSPKNPYIYFMTINFENISNA